MAPNPDRGLQLAGIASLLSTPAGRHAPDSPELLTGAAKAYVEMEKTRSPATRKDLAAAISLGLGILSAGAVIAGLRFIEASKAEFRTNLERTGLLLIVGGICLAPLAIAFGHIAQVRIMRRGGTLRRAVWAATLFSPDSSFS